MRFAYADPPYIGQARKHYAHDLRCAEVDHVELIQQLHTGYDGWALSLSTPSLEEIAHICRRVVGENVVRWGSWCKPFASFKPGVNPGYTWEPVVFCPSLEKRLRTVPTIRDYLDARDPDLDLICDAVKANITLRKGLSGAKPEPVCRWVFDLLGMKADDSFDDLYPGTGIVTRVWEQWKLERAA